MSVFFTRYPSLTRAKPRVWFFGPIGWSRPRRKQAIIVWQRKRTKRKTYNKNLWSSYKRKANQSKLFTTGAPVTLKTDTNLLTSNSRPYCHLILVAFLCAFSCVLTVLQVSTTVVRVLWTTTSMNCNPGTWENEVPRRAILSLTSRPPKQLAGRIVGKMIS